MTDNMMCVVAAGREASLGKFELGKSDNETPLRLKKNRRKEISIKMKYTWRSKPVKKIASQLSSDPESEIQKPFYEIR